MVEHIPFKDGVLGSNPSWITKRQKELDLIPFFMLYNETVYSFGEPKSPLEAKVKAKAEAKVKVKVIRLRLRLRLR